MYDGEWRDDRKNGKGMYATITQLLLVPLLLKRTYVTARCARRYRWADGGCYVGEHAALRVLATQTCCM
jgi:hypothetical protein